jgi:hypothetical protein
LQQEIANADAAIATARNAHAATERAKASDVRERGHTMVAIAREGKTIELLGRINEWSERIDSVPRIQEEIESQLDAAARAKRDAETELHYPLLDNLGVFLADAGKLAEAAEAKLGAVAPAVDEAARAHQVAALDHAKLATPLTDAIRE